MRKSFVVGLFIAVGFLANSAHAEVVNQPFPGIGTPIARSPFPGAIPVVRQTTRVQVTQRFTQQSFRQAQMYPYPPQCQASFIGGGLHQYGGSPCGGGGYGQNYNQNYRRNMGGCRSSFRRCTQNACCKKKSRRRFSFALSFGYGGGFGFSF